MTQKIPAILGLLLVITLIPYETTICPPAELRIAGQSGLPIAGVTVRQDSSFFAVVSKKSAETETSADDQGLVKFPATSAYVSIWSRTFGRLYARIKPDTQPYGPHCYFDFPDLGQELTESPDCDQPQNCSAAAVFAKTLTLPGVQ